MCTDVDPQVISQAGEGVPSSQAASSPGTDSSLSGAPGILPFQRTQYAT